MSTFLRKYATLTVTGTTAIRIPMVKRGVVDFAVGADWTPVAGDVKIAIDGAAAANVTNLPTAVAMGNTAYWEFILTAAELTCKSCVVTIADSATKAVEDNAFIVETFGNASAMYQADWAAAALSATLVATGLDAVVPAEPASPPAFATPLPGMIAWLLALGRNKVTQTATTQLVRNNADAATIGTSTVSDDGTTATRGKFT